MQSVEPVRFKELLDKSFPHAAVTFRVRNCNNLEELTGVILHQEGLVDGVQEVCTEQVSVFDLFPQLHEWHEALPTGKAVSVWQLEPGAKKTSVGRVRYGTLVEEGEQIATLLMRPVSILHQYGSGDQLLASYQTFGPFYPKE